MKILLFAVLLVAAPLHASLLYNFNWDTTALKASGGAYILDVLLIGVEGNQVTLSSLDFGVGGTGPSASVTLDTTINFFNEVQLSFTPGDSLRFQISTTSFGPTAPSTVPDTLSIYLLDSLLNPLPTTDAASALLTLDLNPVAVATFASANDNLPFGTPQVVEAPEPGSFLLAGGALALWCLSRKRPGGGRRLTQPQSSPD